jgi:hypothetical protein
MVCFCALASFSRIGEAQRISFRIGMRKGVSVDPEQRPHQPWRLAMRLAHLRAPRLNYCWCGPWLGFLDWCLR